MQRFKIPVVVVILPRVSVWSAREAGRGGGPAVAPRTVDRAKSPETGLGPYPARLGGVPAWEPGTEARMEGSPRPPGSSTEAQTRANRCRWRVI